MNITKENFEAEVVNSQIPVLVDFWAAWCGPCQMLAPIIEELEKEYEGKAKILKANVDEQAELASEYAIVSIPTMIIFKNGKVVKKLVGVHSFDDLCDVLDEFI